MDRRAFLRTGALAGASLASRGLVFAEAAPERPFAPTPEAGWRTFEVTSRVEVQRGSRPAKVWIPLPSVYEPRWIRPMGNLWQGNFDGARVVSEPRWGTSILLAEWETGSAAQAPVLEVVTRFSARDRSVLLASPAGDAPAAPLDAASRSLFTAPSRLLPTDGIVLQTAREITRDAEGDLAKARKIYEWIVERTQRNPKTRGCGTGDVRSMLETGDLAGKCADLNALFVALARAVGLPARDVYGIRVADSRFGYRSLGKSGEITRAQHCRAEVFLQDLGWFPVDPADVRKVVLEERPGLSLKDETVVEVRRKLFGAWEMNWLAYNVAHDVALPGSSGPTLPFLMYPQAETPEGRLDGLDPDGFRYRITSRELLAVS